MYLFIILLLCSSENPIFDYKQVILKKYNKNAVKSHRSWVTLTPPHPLISRRLILSIPLHAQEARLVKEEFNKVLQRLNPGLNAQLMDWPEDNTFITYWR